MKFINIALFVTMSFMSDRVQGAGIYLWEYHEDGERSCCLYMSGTDFCNPNVPCTKHFYADMSGILDYITRLLSTEKGGSLSYSTILKQAQYFIRHMQTSSFRDLSYHFNVQRPVQFFHNMPEPSKSAKSSTASASSTSTAAADKAKGEDKVLAYLIKLGVARPLK